MAGATTGKDNWLFLDNDSNRTWDQFEGKRLLNADELDLWAREIGKRKRLFEEIGCQYRFVIAPNKESVLFDRIPTQYQRAPLTILDQVNSLLAGNLNAVDLHNEFGRSSERERLYHKNDTHWNDLGGLAAANAILKSLPLDLSVQPIRDDEIVVKEQAGIGDLGNKFDPPISAPLIYADFSPGLRKSTTVYDNKITNHGRIEIYEGGLSDGPKILVFGDSFAGRVVHWLRERASRLVRVHTNSIDLEILQAERPDVVVSIIIERFLSRPPAPIDEYRVRDDILVKVGASLEENLPLGKFQVDGAGPSSEFYKDMTATAVLRSIAAR